MPQNSSPPIWRQVFDQTERAVGRRLETVTATREFVDALIPMFRLRRAVYGVFERQTRATLHFLNLPTRTDVMRLNRQVTALRRDLHELAARLDEREDARQDGR